MKPRGSEMKYSIEIIHKGIKEWEMSELSWDEVAEKYEVPKAVMQYHRRKERRDKENGNKQ